MSFSRFTVIVLNLCFFFNDTATTEIYTLSLHDALPIRATAGSTSTSRCRPPWRTGSPRTSTSASPDRKSTRLNSSHQIISYAVFCLKKKKKKEKAEKGTKKKKKETKKRTNKKKK